MTTLVKPATVPDTSTVRVPKEPGSTVTRHANWALHVLAENKIASLAVYVGFVFVKVLAVSQWRLATALAMLQNLSLPAVAAGATLSAVPSFALIGLAAAVLLTVSGRWRGCWLGDEHHGPVLTAFLRRNRTFLLAVALLAVTAFAIASWTLTIDVLVVASVVGLAVRVGHRILPRHEPASARRTADVPDRAFVAGAVVTTAAVGALVYAQLVSAVWLPHETVTYGTRSATIIGYVVTSSDGELTILQSGTRTLLMVPADSVRRREFCVAGDYGFGGLLRVAHNSFLTLLIHAPAPPRCG